MLMNSSLSNKYNYFAVEKRSNRRSATMADNEALRVALSALYHMVESIRRLDLFELVIPADKKSRYAVLREDFIVEIGQFAIFLCFYKLIGISYILNKDSAIPSYVHTKYF